MNYNINLDDIKLNRFSNFFSDINKLQQLLQSKYALQFSVIYDVERLEKGGEMQVICSTIISSKIICSKNTLNVERKARKRGRNVGDMFNIMFDFMFDKWQYVQKYARHPKKFVKCWETRKRGRNAGEVIDFMFDNNLFEKICYKKC